MQGIILLTMVVLSSTFSLPSRKDEPQQDFEQKIISSEDFTRTQRNLVQFHNMIKCTTSRSSVYYVDYGCYCGYGGTGNPLDATDRCCQVHDECYGRIMKDPDLCTFSSSVYWKIYSRDDTCTGCDDHNHARSRRNLIQFYKMIDCATSNDPLKYNHYGCYCGLGGKGTPVDGLDRCCQTHDACYRRINRDKLCTFSWNIYTKVYKREGCAECAPSNDKCQLAICRCDSDAVKCFARNKIDPQYENYPQSKCN
ncbi:unnamed protein product [Pocillopora meandrina]|uniref:Phospholipase A2 n=1 Tax=Pocillopora meandrina TaxID=46732 RepID=A0AAU9WBJ4_9CNID|nr:unnamed protein product [Pocillopora meandrina]